MDVPYRLVCLGEKFRTAPDAFEMVHRRLAHRVRHSGHIPAREDYLAMLATCDLVVSTAIQENFGIAVIEAILAGCQPLLPNRMAYPGIIPRELHESCLYEGDEALFGRLRQAVMGSARLESAEIERLQASLLDRFGAASAIRAIDDALSELVATRSLPRA
jgi:glycosyltransferase involved in cell wall biosynthesis